MELFSDQDEYEKHNNVCEFILSCEHDYSQILGLKPFETFEEFSNLMWPEGVSFEQPLHPKAQEAHDSE